MIFGSMTGNAQKLSELVKAAFDYIGIESHVVDAQEIEDDLLINDDVLKIFVMANTGEGEPCDNCVSLHAKVKKAVRSGSDEQMFKGDYLVYGLADSSYENFDAMGKFFDVNVEKLGGTRIFAEHHSDFDIGNVFENYDFPWFQGLIPHICEYYDEKQPDGQKQYIEVDLDKQPAVLPLQIVVRENDSSRGLTYPGSVRYNGITTQ